MCCYIGVYFFVNFNLIVWYSQYVAKTIDCILKIDFLILCAKHFVVAGLELPLSINVWWLIFIQFKPLCILIFLESLTKGNKVNHFLLRNVLFDSRHSLVSCLSWSLRTSSVVISMVEVSRVPHGLLPYSLCASIGLKVESLHVCITSY